MGLGGPMVGRELFFDHLFSADHHENTNTALVRSATVTRRRPLGHVLSHCLNIFVGAALGDCDYPPATSLQSHFRILVDEDAHTFVDDDPAALLQEHLCFLTSLLQVDPRVCGGFH